ncbi:hypothetical protein LSUE1_G006255 [Lachnellula suecica]|uniref:Protein-S-isoprenylcysteine O-methyltransferase n=1 Tax=Lachnellula suecica TaxID=602035 RepID=A0A8T9C1T6_9HELO|nr:hypothetical protein LSUE1_G006255 [Lachnellula suecica]
MSALLDRAYIFSCAASLSLFLAVVAVTYVTSFCFVAPNPANLNKSNRQGSVPKLTLYYVLNTIAMGTGLCHALICATYPSSPSILCPNPSNLSPHLFTWNLHTSIYITTILLAGQITTPKTLTTTGLYSSVQHPTYAASLLIFLANGALLYRMHGVTACWLPKSVVDGRTYGMLLRAGYTSLVGFGIWTLAQRVRDEEAMLKKSFGTQWEEYHKRTKRFIPGVI